MKRAVSVICIAALLIAMMSLAGCGINGTYKATELIDNGESHQLTDVRTLTIKGKNATGVNLFGMGESVNYDLDTKNKTLCESPKITYQVDGDTLTLDMGNNLIMILKKQ